MAQTIRISLATAALFSFGLAVTATPAASHDVGAGIGGGPILPGPLRSAHGALATSITLPAGPLSNGQGGIGSSITLPAGPLSGGVSVGGGSD